MVGLDNIFKNRYKSWKLNPDFIGVKYIGIESFSGHMSVYPIKLHSDMEARVRIYENESDYGTTLLYVIDPTTDAVVYSAGGVDELEQIPHEKVVMASSLAKMTSSVGEAMNKRNQELIEFKHVQDEVKQKLIDEAYREINKKYMHHVKEAQLLGYEVKTYNEFLSELSDEDKNKLLGEVGEDF